LVVPALPVCVKCKHFVPNEWTCIAFPDGIPDVVAIEGNDHKEPIEGDHGIQFEAKNG